MAAIFSRICLEGAIWCAGGSAASVVPVVRRSRLDAIALTKTRLEKLIELAGVVTGNILS
ncbi:MAG: hypothetical protein ACREFT_11515 [Acetobacteraceae bacterium]